MVVGSYLETPCMGTGRSHIQRRDQPHTGRYDEHLLPLRRKYCGQRLPDVGKYSWRVIRDEYDLMMASYCPEDEMLTTEEAFGRLQDILPEDEL